MHGSRFSWPGVPRGWYLHDGERDEGVVAAVWAFGDAFAGNRKLFEDNVRLTKHMEERRKRLEWGV